MSNQSRYRSEFYRGLGSVIIGGLLVSTMFTIFLIPSLLSLTLDTGNTLKRLFYSNNRYVRS